MGSNVKSDRPQNPRINANIFEILTFRNFYQKSYNKKNDLSCFENSVLRHHYLVQDANKTAWCEILKTIFNVLQSLTVVMKYISWMLDLFKTGRSRDLEDKDLYAILDDHASSKLANELEKKWTFELAKAHKSSRNPSLLKALTKMFGPSYMFYGFLLCFDELVLKMSQPLLIGELLKYFDPAASENADLKHAYLCASSLVLSMLISILLVTLTYNAILRCSMNVRIACSSIIYRKALKLSHKALGETTVGQVLNLLSNDLNRFDMGLLYPQYIWIGLLQTIIITYFLWQEIGVSSLFGIVILLFVIPLQGWLGKKIFEIRLKTAKLTDERGRLINEIIASIQVIKMYTWEKPFSKLVEYARKKEMGQIKKITLIHAFTFLYRAILIRFQLFTCILSYVLLGNYISIQKVFIIISFYSVLQNTMTVFFCTGITITAVLLATIKRIQNFLLLTEKDSITNKSNSPMSQHEVNIKSAQISNGYSENVGIDILNASATWEEGQKSNTLSDVSLKIRPGQLIAIIGSVGAGKSSIIQLILRELPLSEGKVSVLGKVSYASQEPWLFTGSVQQNILFDSPMNDERYKKVVNSCGLEHDFEQFSHGDKTIVGEKGVTLSGGQKSRINLARALYKEAEIYLLDDPLSAVDSRIGKQLYEKCIKGYLKDKICILTTHQIQILKNEELIILMEKGKILAQGSYQEITASGIFFDQICGFSNQTKIEADIIEETNSNDLVLRESIKFSVSESDSKKEKIEPVEIGETRSSGHVSKKVYASYISAFGSSFIIFFFFFMNLMTPVLITSVDYWIAFWVNQEDYVFRNKNSTSVDGILSSNFRQTSIIVFVALNISLIVTLSIRSVIFVKVCTRASLNLHRMMFNAILRAKMSFYFTNSSGRILNRISNDIGTVDEHLPFILLELFQMLSKILGIAFVIGLINVYYLIPTIFLSIFFYRLRSFYLSTSRSIKRLEGIARSPVLGHMNASLQGLTTIRAYKAEKIMSNEFDKRQDFHSSAWYLFICSRQAIGLWVDMVCLTYISVIVFSFLLFNDYVHGGYVGLVITQIIGLIGVLQYFLLQSTMIENQMISVERVLEYTRCPQEDDNRLLIDKKIPEGWPKSGRVIFKNVNLRYSPQSPIVLKNLNFQIHSTEKIGIVGRTGAGKSSIIQALFRLAFHEGEITIDDVEIHDLRLNDLRSKLSVIPQDPVLYSGTMRYNLDPFDDFSDHDLWKALDEVQLKASIESLPGGLNSKMAESGSNFSVGQKQLICLARALLRKNKILILDEATANIDAQTDALIQNTIRKNFQTSTVITVAHRLNTIMDSDRVLVMDVGSMIEFDHPHALLQKKDGLFYSMVEQTGRTSADMIHRVATENFMLMHKEN